ncbi:MAG: substrate-binding domain-containing protein [Alkalispirochaeta sp.]
MKVSKGLIVALTVMMMVGAGLPLFASGQAEGDGEMYIPVISKGLQHQFWQTVKAGSDDAAAEYGVEITFEGPASEADIQDQVQMLQNAMAKGPSAVALAALDTSAVMDQLEEAVRRDIPIIGFDSGVPNAPEGAIYANASTDNAAAAALAADEMFAEIQGDVEDASSSNPVTIVVLSQDATSESVTRRGFGFRDRMVELLQSEAGLSDDDILVEGNPAYVEGPEASNPSVILDMVVPASPRTQDVVAAANAVFNRVEDDNILGIFASNEGSAVGILAATNDGSQLASDYDGVQVIGFDAGEAQKNAVREGYFLGAISQNPYQIGYLAVELAVKAANGESVSDVDTGAVFYNADNMDEEDIAQLLYD